MAVNAWHVPAPSVSSDLNAARLGPVEVSPAAPHTASCGGYGGNVHRPPCRSASRRFGSGCRRDICGAFPWVSGPAGADAERMVRRPTPGHWGHPGDRPARGTGRGRRPRHRSNADPCSTFRPTEPPRSPSPAVWRWRTTNWTTSFERPTRAVEPAIELHDWAAKIARHRSERRRFYECFSSPQRRLES